MQRLGSANARRPQWATDHVQHAQPACLSARWVGAVERFIRYCTTFARLVSRLSELTRIHNISRLVVVYKIAWRLVNVRIRHVWKT